MIQSNKKEAGFTLVEMLVVLFVIGIILAIAIPNLRTAGESAQQKADQANRKLISAQAEQYFLEHGSYPTSVQTLVKEGYLQSAPTCPKGAGDYVIQTTTKVPSDQRVVCRR